jgi:hypothetical protein
MVTKVSGGVAKPQRKGAKGKHGQSPAQMTVRTR